MSQRECPACGAPLGFFARARVMRRHDVVYETCPHCGLVCSEPPFWLAEAYADPIARQDIGLIARNQRLVAPTAVTLWWLDGGRGRYLDFGGGTGMFVRLMRDAGYDFRWTDPSTPNEFARGFEHRDGDRYAAVTACEVLEHLPDPGAVVRQILGLADTLLFSTTLLPASRPRPGDWWYYGLEAGQHVTIYTAAALAALAARHGLQLHTNGRDLHLLTRRTLRPGWFATLVRPRVARFVRQLCCRRASLLPADFAALTGETLRD